MQIPPVEIVEVADGVGDLPAADKRMDCGSWRFSVVRGFFSVGWCHLFSSCKKRDSSRRALAPLDGLGNTFIFATPRRRETRRAPINIAGAFSVFRFRKYMEAYRF
jgi:hypothetical protein